MDINKVLPTLTTLADLCPIVEQADVHLSFWRGRYVTVKGYEGSLNLDALTKHFFKLIGQRTDFNDMEKHYGMSIESKIEHISKKSNRQVEHSNCFIRIIVELSEMLSALNFYIFNNGPYMNHWNVDLFGFNYFSSKINKI